MVSTGLLMPIDCGTCSFPIISMLGSALCLALITLLTIFLYRKRPPKESVKLFVRCDYAWYPCHNDFIFLYALSEIIALRSNAVLSTVLGISVILTIGFWFNLLPKDIIQLAHIPGIGMLTVGMLLVSLGTTIDFAELRRQWKVAAVSVISVTMAVIFIIYLGPFFMDGALAIAGSPIFAGGNAAMLIILDAVQEKESRQ